VSGHLIVIKTFFNRYDAALAKGLLDEHSVPNFIAADDCGGLDPALTLSTGNVRLMINARDSAKARTILKVLEE
jgi:hypothetical protein